MGAYSTNITGSTSISIKGNEETFKVKRTSHDVSSMDKWVESTEILTAFVEKVAFSSGKTKEAYKVRFSISVTTYLSF